MTEEDFLGGPLAKNSKLPMQGPEFYPWSGN